MKIWNVVCAGLLLAGTGVFAGEVLVSWESNGVLVATGMEPGSTCTVERASNLSTPFVDVNPPLGWQTEPHIQRSDFGLAALVSYDLPSLFSGKLHALCCRNYTKGRDWYDLVWYLTHQPPVERKEDLDLFSVETLGEMLLG